MTVNVAALVAAIVVFVLVALGVQVGTIDTVRLLAAGLALFAAAHLPIR